MADNLQPWFGIVLGVVGIILAFAGWSASADKAPEDEG
jgi:hypothetical protein